MSDTERPEQRSQKTFDLQSVFNAKDSQEVAELYDASAEDYERRILSWGYSTHAVAAWYFGRYVNPEEGAAVLDAGTGT
ncbi:MAG: SAM-dependent methyltransferase, partial [Actinomycetota bacterium]|nr:SAM-dependent methyltransferase [Actinomycetota bacterium]